MQRARHLLRFAGLIKSRNLGSHDAMIAICCLELALEKKDVATVFYTHDWPLYSILREVGSFRDALELRYIAEGKGGISPITKRGKQTS
jgi:hypothetical protein